MKRVLFMAVGLVVATVGVRRASSAQSSGVSFEVASVKPDQSGSTAFRIAYQLDGRFAATSATLLALIGSAYQPITASQIVGWPDWIAVDRFNIQAKASEGTVSTPSQMLPMLRTLLSDRFKVAVHNETRELPIYELVVARADQRLGPQLHPVRAADCDALRAAFRAGSATSASNRPPCNIGGGFGALIGGAATMAQLTSMLANRVNRVVVDRTGLTGAFDLDLTYNVDPTSAATAVDSNAASIFTAVEEQLGLKLQSARGPVNVLVIDHAERPTPD